MPTTTGIHHVTAIARDPQRAIDFYTSVLGLRLAKVTVNYDDPGAYHLYFGDTLGRPGTILTFFSWPLAAPGRPGSGEVAATAYAIPRGSIERWHARLAAAGAEPGPVQARSGDRVLAFRDPDRLALELVEQDVEGIGDAIPGFHGVTLAVDETGPTRDVLVDVLGFAEVGATDDGRRRFEARVPSGATSKPFGRFVDLVVVPRARPFLGAGSVHHVAFSAASDAEQAAFQEAVAGSGLGVTAVQERNYFRSIYFREPGHVLFEIATVGPGFAIDQPPAELGSSLTLPPWLEPRRAEIVAALPPIVYPPPQP